MNTMDQLLKQIEKHEEQLQVALKDVAPYKRALKENREATQKVIEDRKEAMSKAGMGFFNFLKSEANKPYEKKLKELEKEEEAIRHEMQPYEQKVEKLVNERNALKTAWENCAGALEKVRYQSELEASGLSEPDFRRAKIIDEYETTDNPKIAGYIFPDGSLIKMGEEGYRGDDHRFVRAYFEPGSKEFECAEDAMWSFISEGNIRWMPEGPGLTIDTSCPLTKDQKMALYDIVDYAKTEFGELYMDVVTKSGDIKGFRYDEKHMSVNKMLQDIQEQTRKDRGLERE